MNEFIAGGIFAGLAIFAGVLLTLWIQKVGRQVMRLGEDGPMTIIEEDIVK
jgi:hypothetical protein